MNKPTLIYHPAEHSNLTTVFLEPLWRNYFNIEAFDPNKNYTAPNYALFTKHLSKDVWYQPHLDNGGRLIIDHLWDSYLNELTEVNGNVLTLRSLHWIWYNEALWYQHLGYDQKVLPPSAERFFLLLMRIKKPIRDQLFQKVTNYLPDSVYSYVGNNILIENDVAPDTLNFGRVINPQWYQQTNFSLVSETHAGIAPFLSEKSFKPIAFCHPFIIWGNLCSLQHLQNWGFETFDHIIDESYDVEPDPTARLNLIMQQIDQLYNDYKKGYKLFLDPVSKQKIKHNFEHFYNVTLLNNMFEYEIVDTIMDFMS